MFAIVVAALGILSGLFGTLMLLAGMSGLVQFVRRPPPSRDLAVDVFDLAMFLLIAGFCLFVAVRWCKAVRRLGAGR